MLTGQEQYYLERAGYFIRRKMLDEDLLESLRTAVQYQQDEASLPRECAPELPFVWLHAELWPVIQDALGAPPKIERIDFVYAERVPWLRLGFPAGIDQLDASAGLLARYEKTLVARVALSEDESVRVLPSSHTEPLQEENISTIHDNPHDSIAGEVRIRLDPGDVWFYRGCLLTTADAGVRDQLTAIQISATR